MFQKEPILRDQELNILLKEYLTTNFTSNFEFEMDKIHWEALDQVKINSNLKLTRVRVKSTISVLT